MSLLNVNKKQVNHLISLVVVVHESMFNILNILYECNLFIVCFHKKLLFKSIHLIL